MGSNFRAETIWGKERATTLTHGNLDVKLKVSESESRSEIVTNNPRRSELFLVTITRDSRKDGHLDLRTISTS